MSAENFNIVLVDDDEADNYIHTHNIKKTGRGNIIQQFKMAKDALNWLRENPNEADILFLDINMPGINGFEFVEIYNQEKGKLKSKIEIVVLSSSLNEDDASRAGKFGLRYETKPLTPEKLLELVHNIELERL